MSIALLFLVIFLMAWHPQQMGTFAIAGSLVAIVLGNFAGVNFPDVWGILGQTTLILLAFVLLFLALEEIGIFSYLAIAIDRAGKNYNLSPKLLFLAVVLAAIVLSPILTNIGAVLLLTPVALQLAKRRKLDLVLTLALAIAIGFLADFCSLLFPGSQWVNSIVTRAFGIPIWQYLITSVPLQVVATGTGIFALVFYFSEQVRTFSLTNPAFGFGKSEKKTGTNAYTKVILSRLLRQVPWQIIGVHCGLFVLATVIWSLEGNAIATSFLSRLPEWGTSLAILGTGLFSTAIAAISNNLPTVLQIAIALPQIESPTYEAMVYANLIGGAIGAKLTPIGSISTLLWLFVLQRYQLSITWMQYCRIAIILTLPVLLTTLLVLTVWLPV